MFRTVRSVEGERVYFTNENWVMLEDVFPVEDTSKWHKHHDLIVAWAKGAEIQLKDPSRGWLDVSDPPGWYSKSTYRIKPTNPHKEEIEGIEQEMRVLADRLSKLKGE